MSLNLPWPTAVPRSRRPIFWQSMHAAGRRQYSWCGRRIPAKRLAFALARTVACAMGATGSLAR